MNKSIFLLLALFLVIIPLVSATPVIENVTVLPSSSLWLGEDATISLKCFDNDNKTIQEVYANIEGPGVNLTPNGPEYFELVNNNIWTLLIESIDLDRTGQFDATITCKNNANITNTTVKSFNVSELTGYISGINPIPAYFGDTIEIDFIVKKDETKISSGVVFNVSLDGQLKNLKINPAYDNIRGWILKIDSPTTSGIYNVKATAFYNRTNITDYGSVDVRNNIEFSIISVSQNNIKSNDNITVTLKALERGSIIDLDENNLDIKISSAEAEIISISQHDNLFDVKFIAPSRSAGSYDLEAYLNYNGSSYSDTEPVYYIVSIQGVIVDEDNKAMNAQIKFIKNDITKLTLSTDSYGHYSGSISPDVYDLEISLPKSVVYLFGTSVSSFDDPIKYFYSEENIVPGVRNAGLHDYEIDLSYSDAEIEMRYTEKNIINENNLRVFKCSNWNSGRNVCNDDWEEIIGEIDIIRNKIKVTSSTLSAFVIGEIKDIVVDFSLDKETYYLGDTVKLTGIVKDVDGYSVSNASINVQIKNPKKDYNVVADENGVFSLDFPAPGDEGEYSIVLKARKHPYNEFKGERDFEVVKSRSIFIDFPDTVKIVRGGNLSQEFSLLNNGQADIEDIKISLEGLPENYYNIVSNNINLKSDEKKTLYIDFSVPVYAETGISSVTLKIENGNITEENVFGFNIFEPGTNETTPTTGLATGFNFPQITLIEIIYIAVFAVVCFSVAIILKKRKVGSKKKNNEKNFLSDVEKYIKGENPQFKGIKPQNSGSYDKLIITEFPNVMELSKELTKNRGDK
jgi:hypothetical protein